MVAWKQENREYLGGSCVLLLPRYISDIMFLGALQSYKKQNKKTDRYGGAKVGG